MSAVTERNFTLDDASPMFQYLPHSDGIDSSTGWQGIYDNQANVSHHVTQMPNASVTLSFFETGIAIYGSSNASYFVSFDNARASELSRSNEILFQRTNAKLTMHQLQLQVDSVNATQQFCLDKAIVASTVIGRRPSPRRSKHSSDARLMKTHGTWHTRDPSNHFPLNPTSNTTVRVTRSPGDSISFPFRGRAIAIYGPVNATSGLFSVSHGSAVHVLNASSPIPIEETLLYYEDGFNEINSTTITLTNLGNGQTSFAMSRAEVLYFNQTKEDSSTLASSAGISQKHHHVGVIVGSVVCIIGILALTTFGVVVMKRRRKRFASDQIMPFEINEQDMPPGSTNGSSKESFEGVEVPEARTTSQRTISSSSTIVERLMSLIARRMDSMDRVEGAHENRDGSLPPYPASARDRDFRLIN